MSDKEYKYSLDEDIWGDYEEIMDNEIAGVYTLYKGEVKRQSHSNFMSIDRLIWTMEEEAYEAVGSHSKGYLDDLTSTDRQELQKLILDWLDKNAKKPEFCIIGKVTKEVVVVGEEG